MRPPYEVPGGTAGGSEAGTVTVINLVLMACLLAIGAVMTLGALHTGMRSHTSAVADLAALAAAQTGSCGSAAKVVERNPRHGARLLRCEIDGAFAQVLVRSEAIRFEETSRAGPAW